MSGNLHSDSRRALSGGLGASYTRVDDGAGDSRNAWTYLAWRPSNALRFEAEPSWNRHRPEFQFVRTADVGGEPGYLFASLDQRTAELSLRVDYSVTPSLTVQYYGAPFVSAGRYAEFKRVTSPRARAYGDRFRRLDDAVRYDAAEASYSVDEDGDGAAEYGFGNPDFNVRDFNSNLVIRWQYSPGSSLYVVWSQARFGYEPDGGFALGPDLDALFDVHPHNVFLIKMNRWFSL
jgi:hypothetical protein